MNPNIVILLPPATALAGRRITQLITGPRLNKNHGFGLQFAIGLGVGMLVFTQAILLGALYGVNVGSWLGRLVMIWGALEFAWLLKVWVGTLQRPKLGWQHLWLLSLLPLAFFFYTFTRLALLEGTMEFDAVAHWLIKSKFMYYKQGAEFIQLMHNPNLTFAHWDYPMLVPGLYTFMYGTLGEVNDYVTEVWPVWMVAALCLAILSLADAWRRPHPLPFAIINILCFLPATLCYVHWEGGTVPMLFYASLSGILIIRAIARNDLVLMGTGLLLLTGTAMTKFEGIIYFLLWLGLLSPVIWRQKWWRQPTLVKAASLSVLCLLPYAAYRWNKPLTNLESTWPQVVLHSPGILTEHFPQVFGIGITRRFFSREFSHWTETPDHHLVWTGQWVGWQSLVNYQLHLLPWLTLFILGLSLWRKRQAVSLIRLTVAVTGVMVFVAIVISCVPQMQENGLDFLLSMTAMGMARYYFPFLGALFLGAVSVWLSEDVLHPVPLSGSAIEPNVPVNQASKPNSKSSRRA